MIFKDKRGNLHNIERFESLAFWKNKEVGSLFLPHAIADNLDAALGQVR